MIIHSLNLNEGGGIFPSISVSPPEEDASVIIGIGGTGVETLKDLKRKVYTQLLPSNPGDAIPRYDMIRFLAVDTDNTAVDAPLSVADLQKERGEFVCIKPANLAALLDPDLPTGRTERKKSRYLNNWMNIDNIKPLLAENGAGGIRQMGRFMLMESAQKVFDSIQSVIISAMRGNSSGGAVNVHIIAGISGGTGSGCFIDVCYLVRQVLQQNGWKGKLFGYFFLPDVVISKSAVKADIVKEAINRRNGYAAFRELDYLMDLPGAQDYFEQSYPGSIPAIRTQAPPVDLAHLISATDAEGNIPEKGFEYSTNVVSDYIMAYLAHVEQRTASGSSERGLTMEGHLTNIVEGINDIPIKTGSNHCYTILGASNAEVPLSQIATFLAANFYRYVSAIGGGVPDDNAVKTFADSFKLNMRDIYQRLTRNASSPSALRDTLATVNPKDCKGIPISPDQLHPQILVAPMNNWESKYKGVVAKNLHGLSANLPDFSRPTLGDNNSYIALIHNELMTICLNQNGQGGPKYAARLMERTGISLLSVIQELITENNNKLNHEKNQENIIGQDLLRARDGFMRSGNLLGDLFKKKWNAYLDALIRYEDHEVRIYVMEQAAQLLATLDRQVKEINAQFYKKLDKFWDDLSETFEQNAAFLNNPERLKASSPYTWRVIELSDVRDDLENGVLKNINPTIASERLMGWLFETKNQKKWMSDSDYSKGSVVRDFMLDYFSAEINASIETYIRSKYPGLDDQQIEDRIMEDFLFTSDSKATPMFWMAPSFQILGKTFPSHTISVPAESSLITAAAERFSEKIKEARGRGYAIRQTDIGDRIFALRFNSGVPLWAYQGTTLMKANYEHDLNSGMVGIHLYETNIPLAEKPDRTPAEQRALARSAWGSFLPSPIPFSQRYTESQQMSEEDLRLVAEYKRALDLGIIRKNQTSNLWMVYDNLWDGDLGQTAPERFYTSEGFSFAEADETLKKLEALQSAWTEPSSCKAFPLLTNTKFEKDSEERVVCDTFMRYRLIIWRVEDNLEKYDALEARIAELREIVGKEIARGDLMQEFTNCMVTGVLVKKIGKVVYQEMEYGDMVERIIDKEPAGLGAQFQLYKAFCGFGTLAEEKRAELRAMAAEKLDNLEEGDDAAANKLRRQLKDTLRDIAAAARRLPAAQCDEILAFYTGFQEKLDAFCKNYFYETYIPVSKL